MYQPKFRFRGFTALLTAFSFLISLVSGIILYFTPQGKIAHWSNWTFWGLDKDTWAALHINSSLIFFMMAFIHIYYNWTPLIGYIKKKAKMALNLKLELLVSLLLSFFMVLASLYDWQPFSSIIKWNTDIKDYWARNEAAQPPIPHAEEMSVTEFCQQMNIPVDVFQKKLAQNGWVVQDLNETLDQIARRNGISPAELYTAFKTKSGATTSSIDAHTATAGYGQGWGRKTLEQVFKELEIQPVLGLQRLAARNIQASPDQNVRDIAIAHNLRPIDVVEIIKGTAEATAPK